MINSTTQDKNGYYELKIHIDPERDAEEVTDLIDEWIETNKLSDFICWRTYVNDGNIGELTYTITTDDALMAFKMQFGEL